MFLWQEKEKPIIGLSPMDGLTDYAFRQMHAKYGRPDILFTEFTNVEGMFMSPHDHILNDLRYHKLQSPVIAQIFGSTPDLFYKAAIVCAELGFDGVDINMGCPAKNVAHLGGGASLIGKPELAKEIIRNVKKGVEDWSNGLTIESLGYSEEKLMKINELKLFSEKSVERLKIPVSVKTRIGISEICVEEWIKHLLEGDPANITIHGRTLKQMYTGQADWDAIGRAAEIIRQTKTTVLGNGDITSIQDAKNKIKEFNLNGALIGRAALGNPLFWRELTPSPLQRMEFALEHALMHAETKNEKLFVQMRKHFSYYISNYTNSTELKIKLLQSNNIADAQKILVEALETYKYL